MERIKKEIVSALGTTGISAFPLTEEEASSFVDLLCKRYANFGNYKYPLWEHMDDKVSLQDVNGWKLISEFLLGQSVILFVEKNDELTAFEFKNGEEVVKVLYECFGFVFYISNQNLDFLISFNDHDFLIASGDAKSWLEGIIHKTK